MVMTKEKANTTEIQQHAEALSERIAKRLNTGIIPEAQWEAASAHLDKEIANTIPSMRDKDSQNAAHILLAAKMLRDSQLITESRQHLQDAISDAYPVNNGAARRRLEMVEKITDTLQSQPDTRIQTLAEGYGKGVVQSRSNPWPGGMKL